MIGNVLIVTALLWLTLAVAVGFHAKGHNRSGIIWFSVVAITGIFGLAFYLLAITSANSEQSGEGSSFDDTVVSSAPSAVVGSAVGLLVGLVLSGFLILSYEGLDSLGEVSLIPLLGLVFGLILGPLVESRFEIMDSIATKSVNLSRRKTLGLVGGGVTLLVGGIAYTADPEPPKPDLSITQTTVQHDSEGGRHRKKV